VKPRGPEVVLSRRTIVPLVTAAVARMVAGRVGPNWSPRSAAWWLLAASAFAESGNRWSYQPHSPSLMIAYTPGG